ncbi:hypothetical protein VE01_09961 [Pseudogymnoascus verrucosus]|uniref:Acyl-CoA dehydrogenase AidB n=1 Tax=Pseudogymnoascus verrucosus TaxID=342668 RepID=A0A1B8G820_9PEZI|nr:uncharacterized protein VE01_09961 [Pseudogymnoascus verrucosus]OBT91975.1 hypothetical protein VE01_09961 [Pseudogymnoascus verrucosus]
MASSSVSGFFQERPKISNQLYEDVALSRAFKSYLPPQIQQSVSSDISRFAEVVLSKRVLDWVADAERHPPVLKSWDTFGERRDDLVTSEGWRKLQDLGVQEGIIAIPYEVNEGQYSRVYQFLKYHVFSGSSAYVICPSAMTDGAASLLLRHLKSNSLPASVRPILDSAFKCLISRDPAKAWTSGQWMTERKGGSDVSGTETIAVMADSPLKNSRGVDGSDLGPYSISGFKWFSSATDSNMSILLARSPNGNVSAFYAPMRRTVPWTTDGQTELNGIHIQRLKSKLGTRAVPTAELELKDMRGYLLGTEGQGIREIAVMLNITRVHNSVTALGFWGRGLAISKAFARVRNIGGKRLVHIPAHVMTMAEQEVEYRGYMQLTFFTVLLLGISEQGSSNASSERAPAMAHGSLAKITPSFEDARLLLRVLTPVIKSLTAKAAIAGLSECMESLGGVGYLENDEMQFNIARLFRDASVLSIWEGTTDVMAMDMVKVLKGHSGVDVLKVLETWLMAAGDAAAHREWVRWAGKVKSEGLEELKVQGRQIMRELGKLIAGVLLQVDAERDGDEVAKEVSRRWICKSVNRTRGSWQSRCMWDRKIVFGSSDEAKL